jgi:hypothetical protein
MKKQIIILLFASFSTFAQTNPAITSWLRNFTGINGRHYVSGNSTPIVDAVAANVQTVQYNTTDVYVSATGIPAYITGPFLDGNPTIARPGPAFASRSVLQQDLIIKQEDIQNYKETEYNLFVKNYREM